MEIDIDTQGQTTVLSIKGRLDSNTAPQLEEGINTARDNGNPNIVLDFKELEYISSAGLRVILKTSKDLKQEEKGFVLCAMQDYVREVFDISGFDTILAIVPSLEEALARLRS